MNAVFQQLAGEPQVVLDRLYTPVGGESWTSRAVFQALSPMAQSLVMRLLLLDAVISGREICNVLCNARRSAIKDVLEELVTLRVLLDDECEAENMPDAAVPEDEVDEAKQYKVNPAFQSGLKCSLVNPVEPCRNSPPVTGKSVAPNPEELERYSSECWNKVLSLLVNLSTQQNISSNIVNYVLRSRLMAMEQGRYKITAKGYEFMLKDYIHQVWDYIMDTLTNSTSREECLSLLFMLPYCKYGKGYPMDALTKQQKQTVYEFSFVGIVFITKQGMFYPCYIASTLLYPQQVSRSLAGQLQVRSLASVSRLQIVVETNLQVCAYVTSDLHLAMLKLFVDITIRLPNMAMGRITREKSREAFHAGITAAQIIDFLTIHAHHVVAKRQERVIPENVSDQLVIWEQETKRIKTVPAMGADFTDMASMSQGLFETLVRNLDSAGLLLWRHSDKKLIACKPEAHSMIEQYLLKYIYHTG